MNREDALIIFLGAWFCVLDAIRAFPSRMYFWILDILEPIFSVLVPVMWVAVFCGAWIAARSDRLWLQLLGVVAVWILILLALPLLRYPRRWFSLRMDKRKRRKEIENIRMSIINPGTITDQEEW